MNLINLGLFSTKQVALLNDLLSVNKQLMPHIVAGATGCSLEEAVTLLIFLYDKRIVDGFVLVYHIKHQDYYFARHPLKDGLPKATEVVCQICEENIENQSDLLYDFEFVVNQDISFEV